MRYWLNRLGDKVLRRKPILVVDIDSTLYPFIPMFVVAAREALGVEVDPLPKTFEQPFDGLTREQILQSFEHCNDPEFMEQHQRPFDNAAKVLRDLAYFYEVRYYTDRPVHQLMPTKKWLEDHHFPNANRLYMCAGNKRAVVREIRGRAAAIIDDKPYTTVWAHYEARIPHVFAIRNSTNWNLADLPFVHLHDDWYEMELDLLARLA